MFAKRNFIKKYLIKRKQQLTVSLLSAILMLCFTLLLLNSNRTFGDDVFLIKYSSILKKIVLGIDNKPAREDLLFINTSYDPMLIEKLDEEGFPVGEQAITDRSKLAKLFNILNRNPSAFKFVLCDIFFKDPSSFDLLLNVQLRNLDKIIIPYHSHADTAYIKLLFDVPCGLADYNIIEESFLKFKLLHNDTVKTIPLKMYEALGNVSAEKAGFFIRINDKLCFNNVILDFKVRYFDILGAGENKIYPMVNLGEFISLPDSIVIESVKNRIICIGDFMERDMHQTIYGKMPGTLILLNAYLTLLNKENIVKSSYIIFLLICYFLLSLKVFISKSENKSSENVIKDRNTKQVYRREKDTEKKGWWQLIRRMKLLELLKLSVFGNLVYKFLSSATYLALISAVSYLFFNLHLNVLVLAVYLEASASVYKKYKELKNK